MDDNDIKTLQAAYEAFSKGDAPAALAALDDDIEWVTQGDHSLAGTYRGKGEVAAMWGRLAEKAFSTSPQGWFVDDDRVVVLTDITLDGRPAKQADVWTVRDGKASRYEGVIDTAVYAAAYPA